MLEATYETPVAALHYIKKSRSRCPIAGKLGVAPYAKTVPASDPARDPPWFMLPRISIRRNPKFSPRVKMRLVARLPYLIGSMYLSSIIVDLLAYCIRKEKGSRNEWHLNKLNQR
jgi:hypothetical protein